MMTAVCNAPHERDEALYREAYAELRRLARRERGRVRAPATVNTTALVNEAWLKLRQVDAADMSRAHFLAVAARAMRQVLVDHARQHGAAKRRHLSVSLADDLHGAGPTSPAEILDLETALEHLHAIDEQLVRVVDLHVFAGLEFSEVARIEAVSERTVYRLWRQARVYLLEQLAA